MVGLGSSGIDKFNDLNEFLGGGRQEKDVSLDKEETCDIEQVDEPTTKENKPIQKDEKLKHQRSVKFTDSENEWIDTVMIALGTKNAAEAIRWCVRKAQEDYEERVEQMAKKKKRIGSL